MIIGVDVSPAAKSNKTGVEWYVYHAAKSLISIDTTNKYRFYTKTSLEGAFNLPSNYEEVILPDKRFWTHTALAPELIKNPVDVFYSPGHIIPWWSAKKTIATIHDAGFRHYKNNYSRYQFIHATINTYTSAKWADEIIVPSEFIAQDIREYYNLFKKNITVVPNGFDPAEFRDLTLNDVSVLRQKYNLKNRYFIFVGRMEVRKNIIRSLQAFYDLVEKTGEELNFVLIGSPGVGSEQIDNFILRQKRPELVIRLGYVTPREKAILMHGAIALVFPSLYEGFGIPILEAFAAGTPVITGNISSCPEVAGDAAIIVDPYKVHEIQQAMQAVLVDHNLSNDLKCRGDVRAKGYSWNIMMEKIHHIIIQHGERNSKEKK